MGCRWMLGALCRAVIMAGLEAGLSQGCTPCQISAPPARRSVWHTALHGYFPRRSQRDQPRGDRRCQWVVAMSWLNASVGVR